MNLKTMRPVACAAMFVLAVTSCGGGDDNGTGPSGDTLTAAEFDGLVDAFGGLTDLAFSSAFSANRTTVPLTKGLAAQQAETFTIDATGPCPNGGTAHVVGNGSITTSANGQTGTVSVTVTETFSSCKSSSETTGQIFDFTSNPNIAFTITTTFNTQTTAGSLTAHMSGGFLWVSNGKNGGCSLSINVAVTFSASGSESGAATGTVCGKAINEPITE